MVYKLIDLFMMEIFVSEALKISTGLAECRLFPDLLGPIVILIANTKVVFALGLTLHLV